MHSHLEKMANLSEKDIRAAVRLTFSIILFGWLLSLKNSFGPFQLSLCFQVSLSYTKYKSYENTVQLSDVRSPFSKTGDPSRYSKSFLSDRQVFSIYLTAKLWYYKWVGADYKTVFSSQVSSFASFPETTRLQLGRYLNQLIKSCYTA